MIIDFIILILFTSIPMAIAGLLFGQACMWVYISAFTIGMIYKSF